MEQKASSQILFINFNQDGSCFCVGTQVGFAIFNISPFKEIFHRNMGGGIGRIEMLKKTNILGLVGGGDNPKFLPNKIILWDDHQSKIIVELKFNSNILNLKLKIDKIIAVTEKKIYIFDINTLEVIDKVDTFENSLGLIGVSNSDKLTVIAYPDKSKGYVRLKTYEKKINIPLINAHESKIAFLSINYNGNLLATASEKGTLIRIFKIFNGELIQELRRGTKSAEICCINFDFINKFIACTSDIGTLHIFSISLCNKILTEDSKNNQNFDINNNNKGYNFDISGLDYKQLCKCNTMKLYDRNNNLNNINNIVNNNDNNSYNNNKFNSSVNTLNINNINNNNLNDNYDYEPKNQKSFLGKISKFFNFNNSYLNSEWSFAQFRIQEKNSIVSFGNENIITVLTNDGKFYQASFDPKNGGECTKILEKNINDFLN